MSDAIVLKRPIVRIDLAGCYAHIWERSPDAANRFRQAAEATLTALAKTPGIREPYQVANAQLVGPGELGECDPAVAVPIAGLQPPDRFAKLAPAEAVVAVGVEDLEDAPARILGR